MKYYQEITLLPEAEISLSFIWQNVFQQVHIALVENKVGDNHSSVAVGFPQYGTTAFPLGSKLRVFAKQESQLKQIDMAKWLNRLTDYVHIKTIQPVPSDVTHVSFERAHVKSTLRIEKEMREKAQLWSTKSGKPLVECMADLEKTKPTAQCDLPFIYLHSQETKQRSPDKNNKYPLFINMKVENEPQEGEFDCYGFNAKRNNKKNKGTVPQFV